MCWADLDLLQKGCFFRPHPAKVPQKIDSSRIFRAAVEPRAQRKAIAEIEAGIRLPGRRFGWDSRKSWKGGTKSHHIPSMGRKLYLPTFD